MKGVIAHGTILAITAYGMRVPLHAKTGKEIDPLDVDALIEHQSGREQRIKTAREQDDRLAFTVFHRSLARHPSTRYAVAPAS